VKAVRVVSGRAAPLDRSDVDTDQIIPAEFCKRVERTGFDDGLFAHWRREPGFVLDQPAYAGASILVAGRNFGCGSSREHAAWALQDYGFEAVIAASFGDIFRSNCLRVGLVPVELPEDVVGRLLRAVEKDPRLVVTVDVEQGQVEAAGAGVAAPFPLDEFTRWRLLNGLDDIALTMRHEAAIAAFERGRAPWRLRLPGPPAAGDG